MTTDRYLFRGRSSAGEWIIGNAIKYTDNPVDGHKLEEIIYIGNKIPNARRQGAMKWIPVDPATVGQYTGLRDSSGTRIFEGDIVRITIAPTQETAETDARNAALMGIQMPEWTQGGDIIARVSYFDGAFHYIHLQSYLPACGQPVQEPMLHYLFPDRYPDAPQTYDQTITVTGNIHDDPRHSTFHIQN